MQDYKNILIAWASTSTSFLAVIEMKSILAILSAVVLPIVFFTIGKAVDVAVQIYFKRRAERGGEAARRTGSLDGKA